MQKIIIILSLLLIPTFILATSGACSYHNGVNCSAGADINGKVQCNDGWVNSSVYFSDADECRTNPCVYIAPVGCNSESDYQSIYNLGQSELGSEGAILARNGMAGSSFADGETAQLQTEIQGKLDGCRQQINANKVLQDSYEKCLYDSTFNDSKTKYLEQQYNDTMLRVQQYCVNTYGQGWVWNDNKTGCQCDTGLTEMFGKYCLNKSAVDSLFQDNFTKAIGQIPDYKNVADPNLIEELSLDPANADKTFVQIIKDAYPQVANIKQVQNNVPANTQALVPQIVAPTTALTTPTVPITKESPDNFISNLVTSAGTGNKKQALIIQAGDSRSAAHKNSNIFVNVWDFVKNIFK